MKAGKQFLLFALALLGFLTALVQGATLVITNASLPRGTVGLGYSNQLGANNGQSPYSWSLASNSLSLPSGLSLNTSGLISGKPTTVQTNTFLVQVVDANSATTNKALSIIILPHPVVSPPKPIPPTNSIPVCPIQANQSRRSSGGCLAAQSVSQFDASLKRIEQIGKYSDVMSRLTK